ncbi:3D domain-containing protein [Heyndrickxia sp. NPDC080065]|uniref:3D domain-containing protein n=1 Tax=Heyndrickxia sp. NPDC080065 TaxID=3390568 RepID=UPI003CFEB742
MLVIRRIIVLLFISVLSVTATIEAHAETSQESLHNVEKRLKQNKKAVQQQEQEKAVLNGELTKLQREWKLLQTVISNNQEEITRLDEKINETNQKIEKKKEEIVKLEDQVFAREDIINKRLVALQENDRTNIIIEIILNSESIGDFLNRVSAVSVLLNADNRILNKQKEDLNQIEKDKKEIAEQEVHLQRDQQALASTQEKLEDSLQKKQNTITDLQTKYARIENKIKQSKKNNENLHSQIAMIQRNIKKEQKAAKARAAKILSQTSVQNHSNNNATSVKGKELYVSATAYSYEETKEGITALGYNIKEHPNMKLIAVDPEVIPLGKKVWVEGYGVAIAGDTGGAIIGHKIDVLKPSKKEASAWGRKTVKIIILD